MYFEVSVDIAFIFIHTHTHIYVFCKSLRDPWTPEKTIFFSYLIFFNLFLISFSLIRIFAFCIWCRSIISSPVNTQKRSSYKIISLSRGNFWELSDNLPWLYISVTSLKFFWNFVHEKLLLSQYIWDQHNFLRTGLLKTGLSVPHFSALKGTANFYQSSASTKLSLTTQENYYYMWELISSRYS